MVHYLWCGKKKELTFQHYLGLLSALRVLKPVKVFFHFAKGEPAKGDTLYNSWFQVSLFFSVIDTLYNSWFQVSLFFCYRHLVQLLVPGLPVCLLSTPCTTPGSRFPCFSVIDTLYNSWFQVYLFVCYRHHLQLLVPSFCY